MKILVATGNMGKLREIKQILTGTPYEAVSLKDLEITDTVEEDADSFSGNALKKASFCCQLTGLVTIADDSGLCVDALDGAPGVYSARYSGEGATDATNNALLLANIDAVPDEKRTAHFSCAMACVRPDGKQIVKEGQAQGVILRAPRGENGFGYDPLFYVPEFNQTFAELPADTKNRISHRGKALKALAEVLKDFLAD